MKTIIALLICTTLATSQNVHEIPFPEGTSTAKGNTIELSVANTSTLTAEGIKVEVTNAPAWLKFTERSVNLASLKSKEEQLASFSFSVEKTAEVNKKQSLSFSITDKNGQVWKKEITVKIAPPANYELFQNYPNPFNPTTVINYQLSSDSRVALKIYDMLGREVANPVNEQQGAGYHQTTIDAHSLASGTYIYRFIALDEQNNRHVFQKKMVVLK
jgi:hypothetical protein